MSAYGKINRATVSASLLLPRTYLLPTPPSTRNEITSPTLSESSTSSSGFDFRLNNESSNKKLLLEADAMTIFPLVRSTVPKELLIYLSEVFNEVLKEGRTYPQKEIMTVDEFVSFFYTLNN